ncbi:MULTISPECIES: AbrB/MazE/SpoVT family DNA-binding domain-containing protein [Clostridia]|uniref:AbrB/MazE/SpoVT family DNA-binding domain-containing protein n=1 Tax=Clostridia TaxID=186801 RepID=UPI0024BCFDE7|nr:MULTISPECIES: AbrB/MazE/SpoVT family DNA-binding domain-containing protein [Eubacteriales]WRR94046.1 AbrB/MazE/SpoVT family DNA-binding domain-containing protein [Sinanaerobacter sp. ZZT-01]
MNAKNTYRIIDSKGRVLIPKDMRSASGLDYGDIVKLNVRQGAVSIQKVALIEVGDQSPEAVEAYVRAAIKRMPDETQLSLITDLTELLKQRKEN